MNEFSHYPHKIYSSPFHLSCLLHFPSYCLLPPGVYVEKVGDGSGESPYVGLLGIGDEILQVNGEAVAGLSLDQVTRLMTRESTASLRIMPCRRNHLK
uniref:PDZ domain-containing protein n=1 Tax=Mastacembelus armatus TaxID=205130 RepID=A0A7N8XT59_9TELE